MYKANLSKASVNSILTLPPPCASPKRSQTMSGTRLVDQHKAGMNYKTTEKLGEKPFPQ